MTEEIKIAKNMLRSRAESLPEITDEKWNLVNVEFRNLVEEYIQSQSHSPKTKKQYRSMLRQFGWFIYESLNNKPIHKIKKRDFIRFQTYLRENREMSSSSQAARKAVVSSLCNYIENVVMDDFDEDEINPYKNFKNFTRGLPSITKNKVYEKVKVSYDEYKMMMSDLEDDENYLAMAWLAVAFNCGARLSEIVQFKSELLDYEVPEGMTYIMTHNVRLKGKGVDGKIEPYMMNLEALKYIRLWVEKRGYDHEYIFARKFHKSDENLDASYGDSLCRNVLTPMLGRRINAHIFKASCITHLLEQGVDIKLVSKFVAHHNDISTTISHYDLRDHANEKNNIFTMNL